MEESGPEIELAFNNILLTIHFSEFHLLLYGINICSRLSLNLFGVLQVLERLVNLFYGFGWRCYQFHRLTFNKRFESVVLRRKLMYL